MLQVVRFKKEIDLGSKSVIAFETYEGNRVDVSKKFIKAVPVFDGWHFTKVSPLLNAPITTTIVLNEPYIIETQDLIKGSTVDKKPVLVVKDIMRVFNIVRYAEALNTVERVLGQIW
jgi:hypothetical protein